LTNGDRSVTLVTMSDGLIAELVRIQRERDWSDREMAEHLGVSRSMWSLVKAGLRQPGAKFLRAVKRAFPYLDMNLFFSSRR
jgi:transcriptional regulator with XRE-family HTH domain